MKTAVCSVWKVYECLFHYWKEIMGLSRVAKEEPSILRCRQSESTYQITRLTQMSWHRKILNSLIRTSNSMSVVSTDVERSWHQHNSSDGFQSWKIAAWRILELKAVQQACQHQEELHPCQRLSQANSTSGREREETVDFWRHKITFLVQESFRSERVWLIPDLWVVVEGP